MYGLLAINKVENFTPSAPQSLKKRIHFDCCRRAFEKKIYFCKVENLLTGLVDSNSPRNYWFCKFTEVKKHPLSVPSLFTSLFLLVITHISTGKVRWSADFLPERCYKIPGELQEVLVCSSEKSKLCWGWHPSAPVQASSQSAPFL